MSDEPKAPPQASILAADDLPPEAPQSPPVAPQRPAAEAPATTPHAEQGGAQAGSQDAGLNALADVEIPEAAVVEDVHEDAFQAAIKVAFIGCGQGGGRFAEAASRLGWGKTVAINTNLGDLNDLRDLPEESKLHFGSGGAGKDPARGREQIEAAEGEIIDLLHRRVGADVDLALVCLGAGGGTGSGAAIRGEGKNLVDIVRSYFRSSPGCKVGVLATLPQTTEGTSVCANALRVANDLFDAAEADEITPLMVVDNGRISKIWPTLGIMEKYPKTNNLILNTLQAFVVLAGGSGIHTFDRADLDTILGAGPLTFGMMDVRELSESGLSKAVRRNAENGLLAEGFDLKKAEVGALLAIGDESVLTHVKDQDFEFAVQALQRLMGESAKIHRGVYQGPFKALRVYTMIGALPRPQKRLDELAHWAA